MAVRIPYLAEDRHNDTAEDHEFLVPGDEKVAVKSGNFYFEVYSPVGAEESVILHPGDSVYFI